MLSKDFQDFESSCFPKTFGQWHDGLNIDALLRLTGEELQEAEKLILNGIRRAGHSNNSIEAAGYLCLQSASKLLKKEIRTTQVKRVLEAIFLFFLYFLRYDYYLERIVKISWALYRIEKYPNSLKLIISELEKSKWNNSPASFFQMYAFQVLISFGDEPVAIEYLNKCLYIPKFAYSAMYALEAIKTNSRLGFSIPSDIDYQINGQVKRKLKNIKPFEWIVRE